MGNSTAHEQALPLIRIPISESVSLQGLPDGPSDEPTLEYARQTRSPDKACSSHSSKCAFLTTRSQPLSAVRLESNQNRSQTMTIHAVRVRNRSLRTLIIFMTISDSWWTGHATNESECILFECQPGDDHSPRWESRGDLCIPP